MILKRWKTLLRRRVEQLSNLISDENTQQEAADIIRSLIDKIEITPSKKRGHPCVELVGGLAAILGLAISEQQKTAIQEDSGVRRVLLVAGARNRRFLHLDYAMLKSFIPL